MALVSVIIPHFNRADLLAQTIDSVRRQSHQDWEVIVVDDGSDAQQWLAIQPLADERTHIIRRTDGTKGPSRCRNLGVAGARGHYILFLDSDDLLAPWCLAQRVQRAEAFPDQDLWVFPVMLFEQTPGDLSVCWNRLEGEHDLERFLRSDPPWHTSSPLWRRDAFNRAGSFNEAVMYGDDADLHIRALMGRLRCIKYPSALPDAFVRRSAAARITNSLNPALLQSRLTRLREGSKALMVTGATDELRQIWEGQYFVEGEFLLFNVELHRVSLTKVIDSWQAECGPPFIRRLIVRGYFWVAQTCRNRAYLVLRLARRLSMLILPKDYFPRGGSFHSHEIDPGDFTDLRHRLRDLPQGTQ